MRSEKRQAPALTFADAFNPHHNAFACLRLVLAALVVFYHCFPLGGFGLDPLQTLTGGRHTFGSISVAIFFALSGFLITRSGVSASSVGRFVWHRFLRVYPGYWICLLVCGCVFAPFIAYLEHLSVVELFTEARITPQAYMLQNAALFHANRATVGGLMNVHPYVVGGLLKTNPFPGVLNGSVWTLPYELTCYIAVAVLVGFGLLRRARIVVLLVAAILLGFYELKYANPAAFKSFLPGCDELVRLSLFFFTGAVAFLYREKISCAPFLFAVSVFLSTLGLTLASLSAITPFAMTYAFLWLAFELPIRRADAYGDFSYGLYIYAFPLQQILALLRVHETGLSVYLLASLLAAFLFAVLSYRYVEAPCLRWKNATLPWRENLARRGRSVSRLPTVVASAGLRNS